jgi:hypothetical protein
MSKLINTGTNYVPKPETLYINKALRPEWFYEPSVDQSRELMDWHRKLTTDFLEYHSRIRKSLLAGRPNGGTVAAGQISYRQWAKDNVKEFCGWNPRTIEKYLNHYEATGEILERKPYPKRITPESILPNENAIVEAVVVEDAVADVEVIETPVPMLPSDTADFPMIPTVVEDKTDDLVIAEPAASQDDGAGKDETDIVIFGVQRDGNKVRFSFNAPLFGSTVTQVITLSPEGE